MSKTLNDAFLKAKKDRQVLSKVIIWESGVSKSQFYRIMTGKEAPSPETKARISKSLNITPAAFDDLHANSNLESKNPAKARKPLPASTWIISTWIISASLALLAGALIFVTLSNQQGQDESLHKVVVHPEDHTTFIKDVTIPDGTSIPVNTEFVKTWRVKNSGNVVWKNRYLKRMTPASELLCSSPAMVLIPETQPGEVVDISVTFMTPHLPGSCRTDWKTSDELGNLYFPDMHGLFSIVTVVKD
jgi:transcriptional regulator with XRE-family HTH domain